MAKLFAWVGRRRRWNWRRGWRRKSDFGGNFEGNIAGNIDGKVAVVHWYGSHGKPVLYSKRLPQPLPLWHAISCRSFKFMAAMAACFFLPPDVG